MDDTRLLELAGRAAGENYGPDNNPLDRDDLALRLAVKIGMEFAADDEATHCAFAYARVRGAGDSHIFEPVIDDPCKAMRRAITRAAAALGEKQHG
jgi:hypothetical protein